MSNLNVNFSFNKKNEHEAAKILAKYPSDRKQSAIMPLLDLAQRQNDNWLSRDVVEYVANYIDCLLYTSPSPRDGLLSRMPSSA